MGSTQDTQADTRQYIDPKAGDGTQGYTEGNVWEVLQQQLDQLKQSESSGGESGLEQSEPSSTATDTELDSNNADRPVAGGLMGTETS